MREVAAYNLQIWVGLKERDTEIIHTLEKVYEICDKHVEDGDCVSVTKTNFRYTGGFEDGVVIGYINYPRFPRDSNAILNKGIDLARNLMEGLNQYRVTIVTPTNSIMLSNSNLIDKK